MNYTLYNPSNDLERLHEALKMPWVEDAYHEACCEYLQNTIEIEDAYHEACSEYLVNTLEIEPLRANWATNLLESGKALLPQDINTADHCWNDDIEEQYWHRFVAYGACHWLSHPYLMLAEELFPAGNWQTFTTEAHTAVIDRKNKVIFDLTFAAYGIKPEKVLKMINHI